MSFDAKRFGKELRKAAGEAISKEKVAVPCPGCGTKNSVKVADIAKQRTFTCTGCRKVVRLEDEGGGFAKIIQGR